MELKDMLRRIEDYHHKLGYTHKYDDEFKRQNELGTFFLAIYQETAELINSYPWKPWRSIKEQKQDDENAKEEIVDILFFLSHIIHASGFTAEDIEMKFNEKLVENLDRIRRGYNNKPEERG